MSPETQLTLHTLPHLALSSWTIPYPDHGLPGLGSRGVRSPVCTKHRGNELREGMMVALYTDDEEEPIGICQILKLFTPNGFAGVWAHVRWWFHTGYKPYPTGCFKPGVDDTALDNIALTSPGVVDPVSLIHWSDPAGKYPVVTRRGHMAGHVKRLVRYDIRLKDVEMIKQFF